MLLATGQPGEDELARANEGLSALGRPPLVLPVPDGDFVSETPETLAPLIPPELRAGVLELLYVLAGDEPIRRRLADAYAGLWREETEPAPQPRRGGPVLRWLIGTLPRHQVGAAAKEDEMMERQGPYRDVELEVEAAPAERTPLRVRVERICREYKQVVDAVERVIVGKRDVVERVLTAMAAKGHVLLVDVPGVGKTQLCKAIAASIETRFGRIQFTPDLLPMDITGANVFDPRDKQFYFRPGPIFTHILLADEINRATPKTQSALLEVMEERCATVDGTTHRMEEPFQVLATMNPVEHQGTYPLPAAQIDRFMVMLELGYPSPDDEVRVLDYHLGAASPLDAIEPVITRAAFVEWRETVPQIHVSPELKRSAVEYINKLRKTADDGQSISPRATLAWVRCAQARAMLCGREFVTMDDLLHVAPDVLRHRLWTDAATVREKLRAVALGAR
ncbi:MAG: AAA family ATPase [Myxococcales bacterium]|nr:AAA family ATPase [Myxococcales bacterium]